MTPAKGRILVKSDLCTGCCRCVLACSFSKEKAYSRVASRIHIKKVPEEGIYKPIICKQCIKPKCVDACPFGAIRIGENGVVMIDSSLCTGCRSCVDACPFGAIRIHPKENVAIKCDLCGGDPECVKLCVTNALTFATTKDATAKKSKTKKGGN
jgi:carbon-monoxide dehydrogenase iron sulfur subunit